MENLSSASKKVLGITNNSVMYRCHIHPNAYVPNIKDVVIFDYKAYNISDVTVYDNHFTLLCERLPIIPEGIS